MNTKRLSSYARILIYSLLGVLVLAVAAVTFVNNEEREVSQSVSGMITIGKSPETNSSGPALTRSLITTSLPSTAVSAASTARGSLPEQQARYRIPEHSGGTTAVPASDGSFDIVLLMDSSGSMRRTDPRSYRKDAAKLFLSLAGKEDRIGIMSFGDSAAMLMPLTPNTVRNRTELFRAVDRISSKEFSTNILDAVRKGYEELTTSTKRNRVLIIMSDGRLALGAPEKDEAAFGELIKLLPKLAAANIRIYTVAFTEESDSGLLENIARETGGSFHYAKTDRDVHVMFSGIFEKLKAPDTIPFEGEAFVIDLEIREATVVVTKTPGTAVAMQDPNGARHTSARHSPSLQWYSSNVFDMITISEPVPGKWSVKFSTNEGNKVYVLTNLNLKCAFDENFVRKGETIRIDTWLEKQGVIVTKEILPENAFFSAEVTGPDAKTTRIDLADKAATGNPGSLDGKHSVELRADLSGEYTIRITAEGRTFKREKILRFKVIDAPVPAIKPIAPPAPLPVPAAVVEEGVQWTKVLLKFGMFNLVGGLIVVAHFTGKKIRRKKVAP